MNVHFILVSSFYQFALESSKRMVGVNDAERDMIRISVFRISLTVVIANVIALVGTARSRLFRVR